MKFMWIGGLIVSSVISAVFLIILLAQFEAGTRAKAKWLILTLCSLILVAGLIFFKPKTDLEKIQYMPVPLPVSEKEPEPKEAPVKKTVTKNTGSSSVASSGENPKSTDGKSQETGGQTKDSQGKPGVDKGSKTVPAQTTGELTIQDQLTKSLQKKGDPAGKVEFKDPVLVEIQELMRQAEEAAVEEVAKDSAAIEQSGDAGIFNYLHLQKALTEELPAQQPKELSPDGRDEKKAESESGNNPLEQTKSQNDVKARVMTSELNVRDRGNMEGKVVGVLQKGDVVAVIGKSDTGDWSNIRRSSGQSGWTLSKYLQGVSE